VVHLDSLASLSFFLGEIAEFVPKLSCLAQFCPSTMKTSDTVLELSKSAQFRPYADVACHIDLPHHLPNQLVCKILFLPSMQQLMILVPTLDDLVLDFTGSEESFLISFFGGPGIFFTVEGNGLGFWDTGHADSCSTGCRTC
jgi:hypothetical protein